MTVTGKIFFFVGCAICFLAYVLCFVCFALALYIPWPSNLVNIVCMIINFGTFAFMLRVLSEVYYSDAYRKEQADD